MPERNRAVAPTMRIDDFSTRGRTRWGTTGHGVYRADSNAVRSLLRGAAGSDAPVSTFPAAPLSQPRVGHENGRRRASEVRFAWRRPDAAICSAETSVHPVAQTNGIEAVPVIGLRVLPGSVPHRRRIGIEARVGRAALYRAGFDIGIEPLAPLRVAILPVVFSVPAGA